MTALAEDDEEEENDDLEKSDDRAVAPSQEERKDKGTSESEDKQAPDFKDTDPLAALGDKLAKLRYLNLSALKMVSMQIIKIDIQLCATS